MQDSRYNYFVMLPSSMAGGFSGDGPGDTHAVLPLRLAHAGHTKKDVKNADCSQDVIENKGRKIAQNRRSQDLYENKGFNLISQYLIENKRDI
jgi:hypothetical protein